MIRALSSEERAFFVENMIGDLLAIGGTGDSSMSSAAGDSSSLIEKQGALLVQATLKEELSKQPYAGLFILYMISRFEELSDDDLVYWDKCCQITQEVTMTKVEDTARRGILKHRNDSMEESKRWSEPASV